MALFKNILVATVLFYLTEALYRGMPVPTENSDTWNNLDVENDSIYLISSDDSTDDMKVFPDDEEAIESKNKRSQTRCRVIKVQKTHHEIGAEFYPKQYNEYECVPFDGDLLDGNAHNLGTCRVQKGRCDGIQKYHYYLKKKYGEMCWKVEKKIVSAGCNCVPSILTG